MLEFGQGLGWGATTATTMMTTTTMRSVTQLGRSASHKCSFEHQDRTQGLLGGSHPTQMYI